MTYRFAARVARLTLAPGLALLLAACGGGGSDAPTPVPVPPTPVPENLSITAPASGDIAEPTVFGNSAASLGKLQYSWDFGDGSAASTEAAPKHVFAKPGDYEVKLRVSNEAGQAKEVKTTITVNNQAAVRGLECSGASESGWCWQAPRPTGHALSSITFATATTGWRVGAVGEIFKTVDSGKTWARQRSGVTVDLLEVVFWDDKIGWIRGNNSTLLSTRDGGTTWTAQAAPWQNDSFGSKLRLHAERGIEYSDHTIYRSDDSGLTWQSRSGSGQSMTPVGGGAYLALTYEKLIRYSSLTAEPADVLQLKDSDGTPFPGYSSIISAVGEKSVIARARNNGAWDPVKQQYSYRQALWRSEDMGLTWSRLAVAGLGAESEDLQIRSLDPEAKVLLAHNYNKLFRSEDGGVNWARVSLGDVYGFGNLTVQGSRVFALWSNKPRYSDDLGKTWSELALPQALMGRDDYYSMILSGVGAGLLISDSQYGSFASLDKGLTWVRVSEGNKSFQGASHAVAFRDARNGVMVNSKGELLQSADGGKSWTVKRSDLGTQNSYNFNAGLQFSSTKIGFLLHQDRRLYKTVDGGETWTSGLNTNQWTRMGFTDENNGWARVDNGDGKFWLTRDGAGRWGEVKTPFQYFGDVRVEAGAGLTVVGSAGSIAQSSDDGKTWASRYTGVREQLNRVYSRDGKTYWVLGTNGALLRSDDGGISWTKVPVPSFSTLLDIQFSDAKNGWIVGEYGTILATRDSGKTWAPQASGTRKALRTVQLIDSRTGWIVGDEGTLLATGTGGL